MKNGKSIDLVTQAQQLRIQAEQLEKTAKLARGTRDVAPQHAGRVIVKPARGPHWVGDEGPTEQLMASVMQLLTAHPLRFTELLEATGARDNRIKGVIMRLQREGVRVVDVAPAGNGKALWFIPSDAVLQRLTRVAARTTRK